MFRLFTTIKIKRNKFEQILLVEFLLFSHLIERLAVLIQILVSVEEALKQASFGFVSKDFETFFKYPKFQ